MGIQRVGGDALTNTYAEDAELEPTATLKEMCRRQVLAAFTMNPYEKRYWRLERNLDEDSDPLEGCRDSRFSFFFLTEVGCPFESTRISPQC